MAAPRATQFIALRNLARHQLRNLHMTDPAALNASVGRESKRRKLSDHELFNGVHANERSQNRALSSAVVASTNGRPIVTWNSIEDVSKRHFNTSQTLKAVKDSSTIDFAYMPTWASLEKTTDLESQVRVPILPSALSKYAIPSSSFSSLNTHQLEVEDVAVMRPTISTMSADTSKQISPLAELTDGHAMNIDFLLPVVEHKEKIKEPFAEKVGAVGRVLSDMMSDMFGLGKKAAVK